MAQRNKLKSSNEAKRRLRSDSVLGNRMDENLNYRRLKPAGPPSRWYKLRRLINKNTTNLFLFEVPKGFNITDKVESLDLGERLRSAAKGSGKLKVKRFSTKSNKNCIFSMEIASEIQ